MAMSPACCSFLICAFVSVYCSSSWIRSAVKLPKPDFDMLMGYNNSTKTVYIFGGWNDSSTNVSEYQIWKWKMNDNSFKFTTLNTTSYRPLRSDNQLSVTINNYVYLYNGEEYAFDIFDMNAESFISSKNIPDPPATFCDGQCLATNDSHIFVIGGGGGSYCGGITNFSMQIYDIHLNKWTLIPAPPDRNVLDEAFCTTTKDALYVMGNDYYPNYNKTYENHTLSGMSWKYEFESGEWNFIGNLPWQTFSGWAIHSKEMNRIYTMGGDYYFPTNVINIFDLSNQSFIGTTAMMDSVSGAPALLVDNQIYVFGGDVHNNSMEVSDSIQIGTLPFI